MPTEGTPNGADDPGVDQAVHGVVHTALDTMSRAGTVSLAALGDALESAARALTRRVVARAVESTPRGGPAGANDSSKSAGTLVDQSVLAESLDAGPTAPMVGPATVAALALKFGGRFRRLKFLAKRSPAFLAATAIPVLVASVTRGAHELGMVASHLVQRARAEGVEPDLDRVRRAAVQIMSRRPVDPETEPSHGALALGWLRRAVRAALPFTSGVATADPRGIAATAARVDVRELGEA